ncbi:UDP-N-acetylglucosamine--N-acetylmuramyl-(pentapeptide) pyrophosphoryl-undecaprenol N-acetylglucosamine transferase [Nitratiruptor sp. SB155-2]|uniref:UDP-N-acetylglucosamine--N-acetylmuramyl-(pentapeptide) pyrophosphoryl-undecaprenol N-acetylglucosamine transferase n=1 Tax=Nitratiruptor sp. (strain SB155-2) TaxID=387092 RepID=MURG_NITSB|nr:UDP-N-acetylglucosamine--N-acetylmuramyl-(pentapeptide) pyrophosphoryl-undecaprenol N-acetylglucosamine transferase [Nitratiruptor sp. SB155-2]A6Q579.1 RecName: Full=UDP-N-acetylglucosamine--N-acetylmuramyl-(pentapeptide) pyrophosphoryl-undecaprenol N-acetylglucosamine transferase; AltName: Full=Undecaprenyl-PP-MurNAc-pentapeptide-UDPGlcNAc GlcNAc transferase [Nitratiruptor sp. SB155-2]BAF70638.1 undecaprenyldiphospho-muramoylpentapeptide beta-N- acetylglucosaminyltransferase [Nitratiruptor sp
MRILITGGGTGGHLSVAKSLKEAFKKKDATLYYIGSIQGQDRSWFENDEDFQKKLFFDVEGVVNKKGINKIRALTDIVRASFAAKKLIKNESIDAVVSVGGYSAAAASFAALQLNLPLFIHEQNAVKGKLNRLLSPFAKRVFCSFVPPYDPYPVQNIFYETRRIRKELTTIIFLGGSQGAKQINDLAMSWAKELQKHNIKIIHQTGTRDFERVRSFYAKERIEADVFAFDQNLAQKIVQADFAVSRSGASTLWELATNLLPALYIPYPYAAGDHQKHNALFLYRHDASMVFEGQSPQDILSLNIFSMSENLLPFSRPDGATKIVLSIVKMIEK